MDEALLTDASLLIGLARLDEAEQMLSETLTAATAAGNDMTAARALEGLGTIATRRGQEANALELFEQAIARGGRPDPAEHEPLYMNTARLRSFAGDADGAVALLEECLTRLRQADEPDRAMVAHYSITLSYAFADAGMYGRASSVLGDVLRDDGEDLDIHVRRRLYYALTRLNMNIGRTEQAIEYSEKNLDATSADGNPADVFDAYLQCAHVRLDAHDTEQAGAYLAQARRRAPEPLSAIDEGFLLVEEARHALQVGHHERALERASEAVDLLSDDPTGPGQSGLAHLVIARVYDDTCRDEAADHHYRTAILSLQQQTGWPKERAKAYRRYGKFLRRTGQLDAAMEMLELASDASV